ncbi:hypothetical protein [Sphaerotilus sp.]|uniref:hypothetical protein n=1 Tax=Sphaerotilus sp. TaxID=2093942 RepID=UPI0034E27D31
MSPPIVRSVQGHELPVPLSTAPLRDDHFDPQAWTCSVCGKVRLRELLHSKAILGRQQLVCAPSCLGAERRANAR